MVFLPFRADAETFRSLEQLEMKHAEFERTILYFQKMQEIWLALSEEKSNPVNQSYARKQASSFARLAEEAQTRYDKHGSGEGCGCEKGCMIRDGAVGVNLARR